MNDATGNNPPSTAPTQDETTPPSCCSTSWWKRHNFCILILITIVLCGLVATAVGVVLTSWGQSPKSSSSSVEFDCKPLSIRYGKLVNNFGSDSNYNDNNDNVHVGCNNNNSSSSSTSSLLFFAIARDETIASVTYDSKSRVYELTIILLDKSINDNAETKLPVTDSNFGPTSLVISKHGNIVVLGFATEELISIYELNSNNGNWMKVADIPSPNDNFIKFGSSVAIDVDSSSSSSSEGVENNNQGIIVVGSVVGAYLYQKSPSSNRWIQMAFLTVEDVNFSHATREVSVKNNVVIVGDSSYNRGQGAFFVYEFDANSGGWIQNDSMNGAISNIGCKSRFGAHVELMNENNLLVSCPASGQDNIDAALYYYNRSNGGMPFSMQQKIALGPNSNFYPANLKSIVSDGNIVIVTTNPESDTGIYDDNMSNVQMYVLENGIFEKSSLMNDIGSILKDKECLVEAGNNQEYYFAFAGDQFLTSLGNQMHKFTLECA